MKRDEADAVLPIVQLYTTVGSALSAQRIARGEDPSIVFAEAEADFNKAFDGALAEVRRRPWWRRLGNLLP